MWPFTASWKLGIVDTFCHLNDVFMKFGHVGTFAEFRLKQRKTFPYCYKGCVANFSNPVVFERRDRWEALLEEDCIWGSFGCPPYRAHEYTDAVHKSLLHALSHDAAVAVGRIGLDYSESRWTGREKEQKRVFKRQLALAAERRLPVVIYSRGATQDTASVIRDTVKCDYPIHLQGFAGGWPEARFWLEAFPRLCLGLTPALGFPCHEPLVEAARNVPLDRVLFETAAPQFVPAAEASWLSGSHPGMAVHVALELSLIRGLQVEEVAAVVRENTRRFYGI